MANREDLRSNLTDKLVGLEDSGYGDFDYSDSELNTYLELTTVRMFPSVYRRSSANALTLTSYGKDNYAEVDIATAGIPDDRTYMVEDAESYEPLRGWEIRPGRVIKLDDSVTSVNVYYYTAYSLPSADGTPVDIPVEFHPLIVLGGLVEALEARHDTGVRPDPTSGYQQTSLIDRLMARWNELKTDLAMALPVAVN